MRYSVRLHRFLHRNNVCIAIVFPFNATLKAAIKSIAGVRYSATHKCFYVVEDAVPLQSLVDALKAAEIVSTLHNKPAIKPKAESLKPLSVAAQSIHKTYINYLVGLRLSKSTISVYGHFIEDFLRFTKVENVLNFTAEHVRLYIEWAVPKRGYAISTHRQLISALKHFAFFAPDCAIDAEALKRPKKTRQLPTVLSFEEILDILRCTPNLKHRTLLALLYSCGLRIGEALNLKAHDFNLDRMLIHIRKAKGNKDRVVFLAQSMVPLLRNYVMSYRPKQWLFEGARGTQYSASSVRKVLQRSCVRAKITKRVTPHTLRHSFATHMLEQGTDIRYIQDLLGHSKPETTMLYTHITQKDVLQLRSPLDAALERLPPTQNNLEVPILLSGKLYGDNL